MVRFLLNIPPIQVVGLRLKLISEHTTNRCSGIIFVHLKKKERNEHLFKVRMQEKERERERERGGREKVDLILI